MLNKLQLKNVHGTTRTRASVSRLTARYKDILQEKDEQQEGKLIFILENLKDKQSDLKKEKEIQLNCYMKTTQKMRKHKKTILI